MSWEIYVSTFQDGEALEFHTADLRALFERGTVPQPAWPPLNTDFLYEDGHINLEIADYRPRKDGFVVRHIFGQTAVSRLLEAASQFNGLIYWPAGDPGAWAAVASREALSHLPKSAAAVNPVVTETPADFIKAVGFSSPMTKQNWIEAQAEYARWHEQHGRNFRPQ